MNLGLACGLTKASVKRADTELEQCLSETAPGESEESRVFALVSQIDILRSVIFLNTYSRLLKTRRDFIRAEKVRAEAESQANRAGLAHQFAWIRAGRPFTTRRPQNANQVAAQRVDKAVCRWIARPRSCK